MFFVALEETDNDDEEDYVDGEVDLEEELVSALSELKKERKKNKLLKGFGWIEGKLSKQLLEFHH